MKAIIYKTVKTYYYCYYDRYISTIEAGGNEPTRTEDSASILHKPANLVIFVHFSMCLQSVFAFSSLLKLSVIIK